MGSVVPLNSGTSSPEGSLQQFVTNHWDRWGKFDVDVLLSRARERDPGITNTGSLLTGWRTTATPWNGYARRSTPSESVEVNTLTHQMQNPLGALPHGPGQMPHRG